MSSEVACGFFGHILIRCFPAYVSIIPYPLALIPFACAFAVIAILSDMRLAPTPASPIRLETVRMPTFLSNSRCTFVADRCFRVVGSGRNGPLYCFGLVNGGVLILAGRYIRRYEVSVESRVSGRDKMFPRSRITLFRSRRNHNIVKITGSGRRLYPVDVTDEINDEEYEKVRCLDGCIIKEAEFDELFGDWRLCLQMLD